MKAILIDPFAHAITEVEVAKGIQAIYDQIQAGTFDCVRVHSKKGRSHEETIYVDDEGLLKPAWGEDEDGNPVLKQAFFRWTGYDQPLAGRALVLGTNMDTGDSEDTLLTVEEVEMIVKWLTFAPGDEPQPMMQFVPLS